METIKIFTIGFTNKSAEQFFDKLKRPGLVRVVDIRLWNQSQLAGFSKANNLKYFLHKISDTDFIHLPMLAPTKELLTEYRRTKDWSMYKNRFIELLAERNIENKAIVKESVNGGCLLCSEAMPDHCRTDVNAGEIQGGRNFLKQSYMEKWVL
jgi:uncharacterized protein (DUF488 family)